jgi:hypothetical protein
MPYTQAQVDELRARIAAFGGIRGTAFGDQSTQFDIEGARALLAEMERQVGAVTGTRQSYRLVATNKGV